MIDSIINFFQWFADIAKSLWSFFENMIQGIIDIFKMIPSILTYLTSSVGHLPGVISVFATLSITICVIYLIANRDTGG